MIESLKVAVQKVREELAAANGDVAATAAGTFTALMNETETVMVNAEHHIGDLARAVHAFTNGQGAEALAEAFHVE